ncbi:calmodulin-binding protein 25-like [Panicum virgatum]|uniref:VQ domain-containing protein n=1 Tax=Panicum virgatum TaxID=38727 RepID=A0A8T0PGR9_PANVG|nr:calmodulin-binding protein 25-like [Panicum virgatum]KAG2559829.1 hypothetical protein PVAP13_8KG014200 [Panicum virgatum]
MLMTAAAVHMDSYCAHGHGPSPSSSTSPAPPWLPVLADGNHRHQLLRDFTASSAPSTTPATAAPPNRHHLRTAAAAAAARRTTKRRPRPSRKLPTTYITADPASFRRMVHQVTGADDLLPAPPPEALCRPAPYRAGAAAGPAGARLMLPTLDTSAFLLGAPGVDAPCARSAGSAAAAQAVDRAEAGGPAAGACNYSSNSSSSCGGGFPTLDSWDAAHLF